MKVALNGTAAGYWSKSTDPGAPINNDFLRVEVHADILNGCDSNCAGCYIPRKNKNFELKTLYNALTTGVYYPDEITIGPTDIFSAVNFDELMKDPYLKKIYGISSIAYTTSLDVNYHEIKEKLEEIWSIYEGIDRIPDIDFKIVLDLDRYLNGDLEEYEKKLRLFKDGSVQLRINYYRGIFDKISYNELSNRVREDYNAPIIITPSFFNNNNKSGKVSDLSNSFVMDMVMQEIEPENLGLYTMYDANFSGHGCANLSFYNDDLYMNPFIYDGVLQRGEEFKIKNIDEDFLERNMRMANDLPCIDCEWMMSCCERNIPFYLNSRGMKHCILPKKYMRNNANNKKQFIL